MPDESTVSIESLPDSVPDSPRHRVGAAPAWLRARTPARVALRRTGISLATPEVLDFQLAHARARDAVHAPLQPATLLPALEQVLPAGAAAPILLHSQAKDRQSYLQRPDLGRLLDDRSRQALAARQDAGAETAKLAIIVADGLSALAVERNALPLLALLLPALRQTPLQLAPVTIVEQARVAIGDQVAHALGARLAIVLIGERPGLSSPDSLGAYITWKPQPGLTTDAARNCISNIRAGGLGYDEAAARLLYYVQAALSLETTGIALKDPDASQLAQLTASNDPTTQSPKEQQPKEL